ncbi:DUF983 domain-containing protein [Mucilaginibacter kameinonensis]|uniref:DUF983 domain-containing protein n=1 Tax=Mucilaginibacter kameinonensis TaxID=452286 RepID=UPI000EF7DA09|nr:DUF983 domain-containing protein [Mucilaginibacter kameinonensis]
MENTDLKTKFKAPLEFLSAVSAKCPKCRIGKMFSTPIYNFGGQKMNPECPHCGFHFEIEPGYYYVAMFASYALNIAEMVTLVVAVYVLTDSRSPWIYSGLLIANCIILAPFNFRYSRVVLLYWLTPGIHFEAWRTEQKENEKGI